jgi:hypothetical protein
MIDWTSKTLDPLVRIERHFDPQCYQLAISFLLDHPAINTPGNQDLLAVMIQRTIEDWIEYETDRADHRSTKQEG